MVAPTGSGISPTSGPTQGGEPVTIKGTNLCNATGVMFGNGKAGDDPHDVSPDCTTLDRQGTARTRAPSPSS